MTSARFKEILKEIRIRANELNTAWAEKIGHEPEYVQDPLVTDLLDNVIEIGEVHYKYIENKKEKVIG